MPFSDIKTEYITTIPEAFDSSYYLKAAGQPNVEILFKKSTKTVTYSRTFNKVDAYLSYVGGLVGTIIGLLFIMGPYTEKTYEVSLAKKLLIDDDKKEIDSKSFNIGYFALMFVKKFL
jgi:hypothetical protein